MKKTKSKLSALQKSYERGNFVDAKAAVIALLENDNTPPNDKQLAVIQKIQRAIEADPIAIVAFGVTLFLLIFISAKYLF